MAIFLLQSTLFEVVRYSLLVFGLFLIAWNDSKSRRIPNQLIIKLMILRTLFFITEYLILQTMWLEVLRPFLAGMLIGGGLCFVCHLISKGAVGAGDVKLLAVVGYYLGKDLVLNVMFFAVLLAAVYSMGLLSMKKTELKKGIPFAPFVFAGTLITIILEI